MKSYAITCEPRTTYCVNHGWPRLAILLTAVDSALEWVTEKLDRKFVTAMERCHIENPDKKREMKLLKRTILVLICVGLGISALSMKLTPEVQMVVSLLG